MQQARRMAVAIVGFTVTLLGVVMLVTPGPGWLAILLGLGVLGVEFVWARRLLGRLKKGAAKLACSVFAARKIVDAQPSLPRKDSVHGTDSDSAELRAAIFRLQRARPN
jgi:uncharacterized protein (TIGR02611 family)